MFGADMLLKIFCLSLSGIFTHAALLQKECFSVFFLRLWLWAEEEEEEEEGPSDFEVAQKIQNGVIGLD